MQAPRSLLLVKLSALGDQVFALPAINDALARWPELAIDWVVDERFADVPRLHPNVRRVFAVPLRRWRGAIETATTWRETTQLARALRNEHYDVIVDAQGMWKSLVFARLARGKRRVVHHRDDCGEPIVVGGYNDVAPAFPHLHGAHRLRALMAHAVGCDASTPLRYGLVPPAAPRADRYAMLLHGASKAEKLWDEARWIDVGRDLAQRGLTVLLPRVCDGEHERASRIAAEIPNAEVLARTSIAECAALLTHARIVVGLDSGLTHIAAAYGTPSIAIFLATRTDFFAPSDPTRAHALGGPAAEVDARDVLRAVAALLDGEASAFDVGPTTIIENV